MDEGAPSERALGDLLYAMGEALCLSDNIAPELALSRLDALALARGQSENALLTGWRREALGESLHRVVAGKARATIHVTPEGPQVSISAA